MIQVDFLFKNRSRRR